MSESVVQSAYALRLDDAGLPLSDPWRATRRSMPRLAHCLLALAGAGPAAAAMVADCTARGLGLVASRPLAAGSAAVVRLAEAGPERPGLDLPARVVRCEARSAGWFSVGVEFAPPLGDAEARLLRARLRGVPARG